MLVDPMRALVLMVGLGAGVAVTGVTGRRGGPLMVEVGLTERPCCGAKVYRHGVSEVSLADLPVFGRPVRLVWRKRRWLCPHEGCAVRTFTDQEPAIAPPRGRITSRAARWATRRAGAGRAIKEIAAELGCNWHTAMAAVHRWGRALLEADVSRTDGVTALGLDEILVGRQGSCLRLIKICRLCPGVAATTAALAVGTPSFAIDRRSKPMRATCADVQQHMQPDTNTAPRDDRARYRLMVNTPLCMTMRKAINTSMPITTSKPSSSFGIFSTTTPSRMLNVWVSARECLVRF